MFDRPRHRVRPSFADGLAGGGGVTVWLGAFLIALDIYADSGDGWTGALIFVALAALAIVALFVAPVAVQPGCMAVLVLSVPTIYGFLIFPTTDSFADVRAFLALTIGTWLLLFVVSNSRGRPILLGLVAAVFYVWMVAEVTDTAMYFAAPVPSAPDATLVALPASFAYQEITLDDLDSSDPLYPLAESCAEGDDAACDELWNESDVGSDFEEFARTCGGDPDRTFPCSEATTETTEGFDGFDGFDGQTEDDLEITPQNPLDETPLDADEDRALEIGLVSLSFGAVYLAAVWLLDRRTLTALATAFVIPAVGALVVAAAALGEASGSAIAGGLFTLAFGVAIGVVGFFARDRRFMAWGGGAIASVGALIVAADVAPEPEPSGDNLDLIGAGLVVLAFGLVVLLLGWLAHRFLERTRAAPPSVPDEPVSQTVV